MMFIEYDGRTWDFDYELVTIDEWREMKRKYKMNMRLVQEGAAEGDPDSATCVYWSMLRQNSQLRGRPLNDDLKFDAVTFVLAYQKAAVDEQARETAEEAQRIADEAEDEAAEGPTRPRPGSRQSKAPSSPTAGTTAQSPADGTSAGPGSPTGT